MATPMVEAQTPAGAVNIPGLKRFYLEDIGKVVYREGGTTLYRIRGLGDKINMDVPEEIFAVTDPHGKRIALSPMLCGMSLFYLSNRMTRNMVSAMHEQLLPIFDAGMKVRSFLVPNGGNGMPLNAPFANLLYKHARGPVPLAVQSVIKMQRVEDQSSTTGYRHILRGYTDDGSNEISGDVYIASDFAAASGETSFGIAKTACEGGTLENGSKIKGNFPREKLFFFFFGIGSALSLVKINQYLRERGIKFIPVLNTGIYSVTPGGQNIIKTLGGPTDLTMNGPLAITTQEIFQDGRDVYGDSAMCWASDTGERLMHIVHFCLEQLTVIKLLEQKGTPVRLQHSAWKLARALFDYPFIKQYLYEIIEEINGGNPMSPEIKTILYNSVYHVFR